MYGCSTPYLVYGVAEGNREDMIDRDWLEENFPSMAIYAKDVVKLCLGEACYGIPCDIDEATGVIVNDDDKGLGVR